MGQHNKNSQRKNSLPNCSQYDTSFPLSVNTFNKDILKTKCQIVIYKGLHKIEFSKKDAKWKGYKMKELHKRSSRMVDWFTQGQYSTLKILI